VGMNEACLNLMGRTIAEREGMDFAKRVLDFMNARLLEYQAETDNNFNLEATPAEGTSFSLARIDKAKYPDIISANENGGTSFYTNSTQLPVNYTDDVFEALDLQDEIQVKYTGGTVFHTFIGERIAEPEAAKVLVRKICETYHMPYFTLTPTFSVCPDHGYIRGEVEACPECSTATEIYSRVVGYLRPVKQWNKGKQAEFGLRQTYDVNGTAPQEKDGGQARLYPVESARHSGVAR